MGKSTSAGLLAGRGVAVVDTDVLAREVVEPGQPALAEIAARFGDKVLDAEGKLRRAALAQIVFAGHERLKELEVILHPRIRDKWMAKIEQWRREKRETSAVVIPLLFETGAQSHFDAVVCVACSAATQHERLRARGWSAEQIQQRIAAQWSIERKTSLSNYVVWTEGDLLTHGKQLDLILSSHLTSRR